MVTKICTRCGLEKDISMFSPRRDRPCGYVARCKQCAIKESREWERQNRTKEELAAQRKEHRLRRPDLLKAAIKKYRDNHPEYRKAQAESIREWVKNNPEKMALARKNWLAKNEGIQRYYTQNYRAKKRKNGGEISQGLETILFSEQGGRCPYCEADLHVTGYDLDHYIPVDLGGPNLDWNIQLTCSTCNKRKSNKHPLAFIGFEVLDEDLGPYI